MAYIPDEAIDRMAELSAGAWRLYCFLARCRNQKNGKCCPSVAVIMEYIGVNRGTVYALRKELQGKTWASINGDNVTSLFGFDSLKNQTSGSANKELTTNGNAESVNTQTDESGSLNNQTPYVEAIEVAESLKNQTVESEKSDCLKNQTEESENSDKKSEKSDSHIRKNQQREPAKEPAKKDMSRALAGQVREVFAYWQYRLDHQQSKLTPEREKKIQARLKEDYTVEDIKRGIDGCASSPWHMGQNDRDTVYDDIELICRDGKRLESFMAKVNGHSNGLSKFTPNAQKTIVALQSFVERNMAKEDV